MKKRKIVGIIPSRYASTRFPGKGLANICGKPMIWSHRITTLCEADNILVLENGRLVQQGTHEQLLKQDGLYRRIAQIQNLLEDELKQERGEAL